MSEAEVGWSSTQPVPTGKWWESRRSEYNHGLLRAGPIAFACYVVAVLVFVPLGADSDGPFYLPALFFQGIGYLFMMGVANLCYFLGPVTERLFKPKDPERYRRTVYNLGYWFSVALPFSIPLLGLVGGLLSSV